jgi:hypothetical protein
MTQYALPNIVPTVTTGTELADYLNLQQPALLSQHAGAARPPYILGGGLWVQVVSGVQWDLKMNAGAIDALLFSVNPADGKVAHRGDAYLTNLYANNATFGGGGNVFGFELEVQSLNNFRPAIGFTSWGNTVNPAALVFQKSRGSNYGDYSAVTPGDSLGTIRAQGADGGAMSPSSEIEFRADDAVSAGIVPGSIHFKTTVAGTYLKEVMRIDSRGRVTIGSQGNAYDSNLEIAGTGNYPKVTLAKFTNDANGNQLAFIKDRGAVINSAHAPLVAGDTIMDLTCYGWEGAAYANAAMIRIIADYITPIGGGMLPGRIDFYTNGPAGVQVAMCLNNKQQMLLGTSNYDLTGTGTPYCVGIDGQNLKYCIVTSNSQVVNATHLVFVNGNGVVGSIACNGSVTTYNTGSDYRLKENDAPLVGAADIIRALRPISFDWKTGGKGVGFFAHEVEAIIPSAVSGEKDATGPNGSIIPQGVDHSKIVPYLVAALKEANDRISALETA